MTLPNGEVNKGSKSFKDKSLAQEFKKHCEKRAKELKNATFIEDALLEDAVIEWEGFSQVYSTSVKANSFSILRVFAAAF